MIDLYKIVCELATDAKRKNDIAGCLKFKSGRDDLELGKNKLHIERLRKNKIEIEAENNRLKAEIAKLKKEKKAPCYNQLCGKLGDAVSKYNKERLEKRKLLDMLRSARGGGDGVAEYILNKFSEYVKKKGKE